MQTSPPASPPLRERPQGASHALDDAQAQARTQWVDVARGLGIVLVVFGHAVGGVVAAGLATPDSLWSTAFFFNRRGTPLNSVSVDEMTGTLVWGE